LNKKIIGSSLTILSFYLFREQLAKETGLSMRVIQVGLKIITPLTIHLIRYNSVLYYAASIENKIGEKIKSRYYSLVTKTSNRNG
jgi:hypothetical protein